MQIAFYMSPGNLARDAFLTSKVGSEGWIELSIFAGFKRMVELAGGSVEVIADAVAAHCAADLELSADRLALRRRVPVPLNSLPQAAASNRPGAPYVRPLEAAPSLSGVSISGLAPSVATLFASAAGTPLAATQQVAYPAPVLVPGMPSGAVPLPLQQPQQQQWFPQTPGMWNPPPAPAGYVQFQPAGIPAGGSAAQYWQTLIEAAPVAAPIPPLDATVAASPSQSATSEAGSSATRPHFNALLGALARGSSGTSSDAPPLTSLLQHASQPDRN